MLLDRTRRSVRAVIPCDVRNRDPLLDQKSVESTFDIIISAFCIECAVSSPKEYPSAIANVVQLLRPSGYLIMMVNAFILTLNEVKLKYFLLQGGLEGEYYFIDKRKIPRIKLTREMMESALENAGCRIVDWQELPRNLRPAELPIDYRAMFFCAAKKN